MPQTMATTVQGSQIIGGTFSDRALADQAVDALQENLGIPPANIQLIVQLSTNFVEDLYAHLLSDRGVSDSQARYYDHLIRQGKVLVAVYDVMEPGPVIDILDQFHAQFNPDGSRNLRDDVLGMTTGAAVGAVALGTVGGAVAGPSAAVLGAATGAVLGASTGAAIGKAVEHCK